MGSAALTFTQPLEFHGMPFPGSTAGMGTLFPGKWLTPFCASLYPRVSSARFIHGISLGNEG